MKFTPFKNLSNPTWAKSWFHETKVDIIWISKNQFKFNIESMCLKLRHHWCCIWIQYDSTNNRLKLCCRWLNESWNSNLNRSSNGISWSWEKNSGTVLLVDLVHALLMCRRLKTTPTLNEIIFVQFRLSIVKDYWIVLTKFARFHWIFIG